MSKKKTIIVDTVTGEELKNATVVKHKYADTRYFMKLYLNGAKEISKKKTIIVDTVTGEELKNATVVKHKYADTRYFMKLYLNGAKEISKMRLRGESMRVLFYILGECTYGNVVNIPQKEIAEELGIMRPAVGKAIKELLDNEVLLPGSKDGRCNTYRLNHAIGSRGTASLDNGKYKPLTKKKPKKEVSKEVVTAG